MYFFDPTIDYSKDLLDPAVPDLFVVQSESILETNPPWNSTSGSVRWTSLWIEYAAVDRDERHVQMTFLDTHSASREEKRQIVEYSKGLDDGKRTVGWYKCASSMTDCLESLAKGKLFRQLQTRIADD